MRWRSLFTEAAAVMLLVFILSNIISWIRAPEHRPESLPETTVRLVDGTLYRLKKGRPLVIHFWAAWCRVCRAEMSNIQHVAARYDVLTVAVESGDDTDVKRYMREHGIDLKVLNDRDGLWRKRFGVAVFPTTFVYDAKGALRFIETGYTTTAGLLARMRLAE